MSPPKKPTSTNPNSLKIRLAYRFLHNLNNLNTKRSILYNTPIHHRSHRVKIAAYASMASMVGSRRAWSREILRKIRTQGMLIARKKKRVDHTTTHHLHAAGSKRRTSSNDDPNPTREYVDPFGDSGQEVKLRKLVPGVERMDACGLLDETADYIKCLAAQVDVMRTLVDLYSTF
ncbi:hypothetical protein SSX86_019255 [Deinandra increscens subsp. villosa]|uniref:IBH1-like N-terminal domain-containing protein n=1 Tax=Deinandra increscens subsp. villosa TaxID=3103831 RepID=A0AAP0GX24_9ASTR